MDGCALRFMGMANQKNATQIFQTFQTRFVFIWGILGKAQFSLAKIQRHVYSYVGLKKGILYVVCDFPIRHCHHWDIEDGKIANFKSNMMKLRCRRAAVMFLREAWPGLNAETRLKVQISKMHEKKSRSQISVENYCIQASHQCKRESCSFAFLIKWVRRIN